MKVAVTGSEGFIGKRVVRFLLNQGADVLGIDMAEPNGQRDYRYEQNDLNNARDIFPKDWVSGDSFTLVHLAWCMERGSGYLQQSQSLMVLARLLDASSGTGLKRLIALGSAEEYGDLAGALRTSMRGTHYISPYGWAKRAGVELVQDWSRRSACSAVWLRPFIVYGEGQKGDMLIPYALRCARARCRADFSSGLQQRDFIHVDDVALGVVCAVRMSAEGFNCYNLGCGIPVHVRDVLERMACLMDAQELFHFGTKPMRAGEPDTQYADASEKGMKGWKAEISWREGVERLCTDEDRYGLC
jgi:nucleoside-diphosphate-sugar epimerase